MLGATIGYQVAIYSGEHWICYSDPDADDETLCLQAKSALSQSVGGLPDGYYHFWVIERDIPC